MATKNKPAIRLTFSLTQGSADAFKEYEINTGLSALANVAYRIIEVGLQLSSLPNASANIEFALSRQSNTVVTAMDDRSLLYREAAVMTFTTSGAVRQPTVSRWQPLDKANVIIVEEVIYAQLDSAGTSAANGALGYILVEQVSVSEADKVALIAQSLGNF